MIEEFLKASNRKYDRIVELEDGCELYIRRDFAWYPCLVKREITYIGNGSTIVLDGSYIINFKR